MSHNQKIIVWPVVSVMVVLFGALAFVAGRPRHPIKPAEKRLTMPLRATPIAPVAGTQSGSARHRNLSLQPEAFSMGRRLGQRFSPAKRDISILVATLTIGSEPRIVQITRTQKDDGEQVEIKIAGSTASLNWDAKQGALSSGSRATGSDRELIERVALDSPDQFVLAQLRGASYFTVAHNVRPAKADDKYSGPLWNVIRVNDPEADEAKRPESRWRMYYLNTATGLIDRIESEFQGQRLVAEVLGWIDQSGETIPSRIIWTYQGQAVLDYRVTTFSKVSK